MSVEPTQEFSSDALQNECAEYLRTRLGEARYRSWFKAAQFEISGRKDCLNVIVGTRVQSEYIAQHFAHELTALSNQLFGTEACIEVVYAPSDRTQDVDTIYQPDMFEGNVSDLAVKDDVHLMGIAPFTLQPRGEKRTRLEFRDIDGADIIITGHPDYGLPSAHDHLIVQMMESELSARVNVYRKQLAYYEEQKASKPELERPHPPERKFRPTTRQIKEFCGDSDVELGKRTGGKQSSLLEGRLDRLKNTTTKVRQTSTAKKRIGTFSFIADYRVLSETESGNIEQVEIDIPSWIYDGIVRTSRPTILTFDNGYRKLKSPVEMFLYRLFRSQVGEQEKFFPFEELHRRSGSRQAPKEFNRDRTKWVKEKEDQGFFNWNVSVEGNARLRGLKVSPKATDEGE